MKLRNRIFIMVILLVCFSTISMATINPENFMPDPLVQGDYERAFALGGTIVSALTIVGTVLSIVMVMGLGIKYMAGSVEEKAEYKKTMIPMLVGAILLFAGSRIVSIIYELVQSL